MTTLEMKLIAPVFEPLVGDAGLAQRCCRVAGCCAGHAPPSSSSGRTRGRYAPSRALQGCESPNDAHDLDRCTTIARNRARTAVLSRTVGRYRCPKRTATMAPHRVSKRGATWPPI